MCDSRALPKLAQLADVIEQDNDKAHALLKSAGDELCDVLEYFDAHRTDDPYHPKH
jgi:hypothetical protein